MAAPPDPRGALLPLSLTPGVLRLARHELLEGDPPYVVSRAAPHILIVDDEENHRRSLAIGLRIEGFHVSEACDGEDALAWLEQNAPDLAIGDLMMPGMNGLDLARRMRMRHPEVRVVLTSAYHLTERQVERAAVGVIAFVPKPYSMDELAGFLRAKLSRRASTQSL